MSSPFTEIRTGNSFERFLPTTVRMNELENVETLIIYYNMV